MGRKHTGAVVTTECQRIELSYLLKKGLFPRDGRRYSTLTWSGGGSIMICANNSPDKKYIELTYTVHYRGTGTKVDQCYRVYIDSVPSNLGKGEVYYFICPSTGIRCRVLYMAYGSQRWKCRQAYNDRIYYPLQQCSKLDKYNTKYWALDKRLYEGERKRVNATYRGKPSKTSQQQAKLIRQYSHADAMRWSAAGIPKHLYASIMAGINSKGTRRG
jgi:hypothetical protein